MMRAGFGGSGKRVRVVGAWLVGMVLAIGATALAKDPPLQTVRLICLPGTPLAVVTGEMHGTFAKYGIRVESQRAKNADDLREILATGKADIAESSVANAVAATEAGSDVVIVMGGEALTSELIVQPGIKSVKDLRGKTIITDGTDTAYTMAIKKILLMHGLKPGADYQLRVYGLSRKRLQGMEQNKSFAATVEKPPTSILAERAGLVSLGPTQKLMGMAASQGIGAFVRRAWARQHADLLERYMAAFIESQRWLESPANKSQVIAMIAKDSRIPPEIAALTYQVAVKSAWQWDARFNPKGFANGLKLQAEIEGAWGGKPPAASKYYDLSYYRRARSMVKSAK